MSTDVPAGIDLGASYKLTKHLGAGGFGDVYEAVHLESRELVALKVTHRALAPHPAEPLLAELGETEVRLAPPIFPNIRVRLVSA